MRTPPKRLLFALAVLVIGCGREPHAGAPSKGAPGARPAPPADRLPGRDFYPGDALSDRVFFIRTLGARCVDFGGRAYWAIGAPVYIYGCNGSIAQQVRVKEIDTSHDVELQVQSDYCIGVRGGAVALGSALELQTCNGSPAQRFALDGDAILMGVQTSDHVTREYAIRPDHAYTLPRTPLVVGPRDASDAEYFRFEAMDHSDARPTSGFVRVASEGWLKWALSLGWGTVIEIDDRAPLILSDTVPKGIHAGVTLRGYRKLTGQGPEIVRCVVRKGVPAFELSEDNVRVTGFRLRGPTDDSRCPSGDRSEAMGILIGGGNGQRILIDHLDVSYFTGSSVDVRGGQALDTLNCSPSFESYPRTTAVRVIGNFLHHSGAYGTVAGGGAFIQVRGNVYYGQRRHSIASDPNGLSGYFATDNLVLSPSSGGHDFDAHGSRHGKESHWYDGLSGDYYEIGWNTFLQTDERNFYQRGTPCRFTAIHDNVFRESKDAAIGTLTQDPAKHVPWNNAYGAADPTSDLAVGDFDGDGISDVFVGTGAAWYFSSGGQAEWRLLNRMPEHASALRFGDFDGDLRTDVMALHNGTIDVSWGGGSPWQPINVTAWALSDLAVGDFDGDRRADLFLAMGTQWFYAPGGRNWKPFAVSSFRTPQLRFGDFNHDGKTDVLGVVGGQWQIVPGGDSMWKPLNAPIVSPTAGLVVGDFDGDTRADVARDSVVAGLRIWMYSSGAHGPWTGLRGSSRSIVGLPIGRFDGNSTTDLILWDGVHFNYAAAGRDPVQRLSRQVMR